MYKLIYKMGYEGPYILDFCYKKNALEECIWLMENIYEFRPLKIVDSKDKIIYNELDFFREYCKE